MNFNAAPLRHCEVAQLMEKDQSADKECENKDIADSVHDCTFRAEVRSVKGAKPSLLEKCQIKVDRSCREHHPIKSVQNSTMTRD